MRLIISLLISLLLVTSTHAETRVWLFRGMGGNWGGLAPGVDQIAAKERRIPGVTSVRVFEYYQTQQVANEISHTPSPVKVVVGGYSCGANSATVVANAFHRPIYVEGIQASVWCGSYWITPNVPRAQETLNSRCWRTVGLGCRQYAPAPGTNPGVITIIDRPDGHLYADDDPDAQADMVRFVSRVQNGNLFATAPSGHVRWVTCRRGQRC